MWAPATLKLIFPPAQTPPSQIYAARASSPRKGFDCASRLGPGVCGAVRCGAPYVCLLFIIILVVIVLVVLVSVGVDRRRVANNTIPPHYRHPPRQRQTTSERTLARPLAPRCLPRSLSSLCARGLSDATRRRITRRSARSEVGRPATGQPSDTFS